MEPLTLMRASMIPAKDAVVSVMKGAVGAHVGLLYLADDSGTRRHLHLAFHYRLANDSPPPADAFWVEPHLDELEIADVRASARLIARRHQDGRVPYALHSRGARFNESGGLELNKSRGLTCATFVLLVFEHANIILLDAATWEQGRSADRTREDTDAQARLVSLLREYPNGRAQAELIASDVGCMRIRAEEVAAASGMPGRPISFAGAERQGHRVLKEILTTPADL